MNTLHSLISFRGNWARGSQGLLVSLSLVLLLALIPIERANAGSIVWGGSVGDLNVDSRALPLTSAMTFQLGVFTDNEDGSSFDPESGSYDLWQSHWVAFDQSIYSEIVQDGETTEFGLYTGGATLLGDLTSNSDRVPGLSPKPTFEPGAQAYIWGFNDQSVGLNTEWLLVTNDSSDGNAEDDWTIPSPSSHSPDTTQLRIAGATKAVVGALGTYRSDDNSSDILIGDGDVLSRPEQFSIQTHTLLPIVPEPSSALLILIGFGSVMFRRRR